MATKFALETAIANLGRRSASTAMEGKARHIMAKFTTAAADGAPGVILGAIGDVIILGRLPNGARVLPYGKIYVSATLGAAATVAAGTYRRNIDGSFTAVSAARYRAAAIVASDSPLASNTTSENAFDELAEELWLGLVVAVAALANGVTVITFLPYVSD